MEHGGKRLGAGRKQGFAAKSAEEARRVLAGLVAAEIEPIANALIAKAKKGDIAAARELFDRAFGKAPQATTIYALPKGEAPLANNSTEDAEIRLIAEKYEKELELHLRKNFTG